MNQGTVYKEGNPQTIFKDIKMLQEIGLDLPFSMKINQLLGFDLSLLLLTKGWSKSYEN